MSYVRSWIRIQCLAEISKWFLRPWCNFIFNDFAYFLRYLFRMIKNVVIPNSAHVNPTFRQMSFPHPILYLLFAVYSAVNFYGKPQRGTIKIYDITIKRDLTLKKVFWKTWLNPILQNFPHARFGGCWVVAHSVCFVILERRSSTTAKHNLTLSLTIILCKI